MKTIQSKNYQQGTYKINEIFSSCFDDKCFIPVEAITQSRKSKFQIKTKVLYNQC